MAIQQFTGAKLSSYTNDVTIHQTERTQMNNNVLTSEPSLTNIRAYHCNENLMGVC